MEPLQFANLIQPTHSRTSCSDEKPINGFHSTSFEACETKVDENGVEWHTTPKSYGHFRCDRCAVLEILLEDYELEKQQAKYLSNGSYDAVMAATRFKQWKRENS